MTAVLEWVISFIAPHTCLVCSIENNTLCESCSFDVFTPLPSACVFCQKPTIDWRVCDKCQKHTALHSVWVAGDYSGEIANLIKLYKFERVRAAHKPLSKAIDSLLPYIRPDDVIVPLPTARRRIRERGYDQSVLLAKELAKLRGLEVQTALVRLLPTRQLGAGRKLRQAQAKLAYGVNRPELIKGKRVWLVDDICTTGASLSAAADALVKSGADGVNAAVVAWQRFDG